MISHREAETLISARLDQQLDPLTERELSAHLATCPQCRAFARSTDALASGLRELPYLPASPTVSRGVMARVDEGRSPWSAFGGFLANPGPALSTLAIIAVVLLLGFFVLDRFVLDDGSPSDPDETQLASQPTVPPQTPGGFVLTGTPEPTATSEPETDEPTATTPPEPTETQAPEPTATKPPEPTNTQAPEPTATTPPEPTETQAPEPTATTPPAPTETQAPEPTATAPPEPTATTPPEPTATTPPEPTATTPPEPTATSEQMITTLEEASTPEPVDLTGSEAEATAQETSTPEPEPTTAPEPTATEIPEETPAPEPTATATPEETPAPEPTATDVPEPTATAPPEPTATEVPSTPEGEIEAPPIVPIDGGEVIEAPEDVEPEPTPPATDEPEPTSEPDSTSIPDETEIPIQPVEPGDGTGSQTIEPIGGQDEGEETPEPTQETIDQQEPQTPEPTGEGGGAGASVDESGNGLAAKSEPYGNIAGDPSGRLVLLDGGRMEFQGQAHPAPLTSSSGVTAETAGTDNGQAITLCANGECTDVTSESVDGEATNTPLGWINGALIYVRNTGGAITYHSLVPDETGTGVASDTVLYDGSVALEPVTPVYRAQGLVWVITQNGGWLVFTDSTVRSKPVEYSDPHLLRFYENGGQPRVAYVAGGQVIVATSVEPGIPIGSAPFSGVDFDLSPDGNEIVVSTGSSIEIYDLNGTLLNSYSSPEIQPGTVLWLNSGIVYQDTASGLLMQIPNPQP